MKIGQATAFMVAMISPKNRDFRFSSGKMNGLLT